MVLVVSDGYRCKVFSENPDHSTNGLAYSIGDLEMLERTYRYKSGHYTEWR